MDYLKFMPVVANGQFRHWKHLCPICGRRIWSVWANAVKHWQSHAPVNKEEEVSPFDAMYTSPVCGGDLDEKAILVATIQAVNGE